MPLLLRGAYSALQRAAFSLFCVLPRSGSGSADMSIHDRTVSRRAMPSDDRSASLTNVNARLSNIGSQFGRAILISKK
jgi:hypothetical protein